MTKADPLYDVWWQKRLEGEQQMEDRHLRGWREMVCLLEEADLSGLDIVDFGCNQGGFLRYLYGVRPFRSAVGIDLARESIAVANSRKGELPISYVATGSPEELAGRFDLAISQSVIYLIADLETHAWKIRQMLRPGGIYYATYTDMNANPSCQHFNEWINRNSLVKAQSHTLDSIARVFAQEGFQVQLQKRRTPGYLDLSREEDGFLCMADRMQAAYEQAYVFRFVLRK